MLPKSFATGSLSLAFSVCLTACVMPVEQQVLNHFDQIIEQYMLNDKAIQHTQFQLKELANNPQQQHLVRFIDTGEQCKSALQQTAQQHILGIDQQAKLGQISAERARDEITTYQQQLATQMAACGGQYLHLTEINPAYQIYQQQLTDYQQQYVTLLAEKEQATKRLNDSVAQLSEGEKQQMQPQLTFIKQLLMEEKNPMSSESYQELF